VKHTQDTYSILEYAIKYDMTVLIHTAKIFTPNPYIALLKTQEALAV
jgi:hypothetical protein